MFFILFTLTEPAFWSVCGGPGSLDQDRSGGVALLLAGPLKWTGKVVAPTLLLPCIGRSRLAQCRYHVWTREGLGGGRAVLGGPGVDWRGTGLRPNPMPLCKAVWPQFGLRGLLTV